MIALSFYHWKVQNNRSIFKGHGLNRTSIFTFSIQSTGIKEITNYNLKQKYAHILVTAITKSIEVLLMLHFNGTKSSYLIEELYNSHVNGRGRNFLGHLYATWSSETPI